MATKKIHNLTITPITIVLFIITTLCGCDNGYKNPPALQRPETAYSSSKLLSPTPHTALCELLSVCGINHDGSAQDIINKTQQAWLRKPGTERWEMDTLGKVSETYLPYFEKLGMVHEVAPSRGKYDYAFILGATASSVRNRLAYLVSLWEKGIRFTTVVLLGSDRPLNSTVETDSVLKNMPQQGLPTDKKWQAPATMPKTESSMMRMLYEQVEMPDAMRKCPLIVVSSSQTTAADGTIRRATTADTIIDWLKMNMQPGTCLFISSQPYVGYQHAVVQTLLPQNFIPDTVGPHVKDPSKLDISIFLDTLARRIFQEYNQK